MNSTNKLTSRIIAVMNARDRAQNSEFKQLWNTVLSQLLQIRECENTYDTIH